MPELPEVEVSRLGVSAHLSKKIITDIVVRTPKLRWDIPKQDLARLVGKKITAVSRRAKYLVIETDSGHIIIHLGMSGSLRVIDENTPLKKHDHVDIAVGDKVLRLNDPRRFGAVLFCDNDGKHKVFEKLGPEPLTEAFNAEHLQDKCSKRRAVIKQVIMDNPVVVGVGNIYANEALFLTGIHPQTPANELTKKQVAQLVITIKDVLTAAIKQGGTTLKDFSQADGKPGYFSQSLFVYGRGKEECLRCKTTLEEVKIGQRASVYCPKCQPR